MARESFDAERLVVAVWDILARAIVPESGPDRDYLNELAAALKPGKAQEVLIEARAILVRWHNHDSSESDREYLDELLMLLGGPKAISVAEDYIHSHLQRSGAPRRPRSSNYIMPVQQSPAPPPVEAAVSGVGHTISEVERNLILDTLNEVDGNRTVAATLLGISLRTLRNKLHQYADEGQTIPKRRGAHLSQ
jgi:DNA-binding NtrC family response regulator